MEEFGDGTGGLWRFNEMMSDELGRYGILLGLLPRGR